MKTIVKTLFVLSFAMACTTEDTPDIPNEQQNTENPKNENPKTETTTNNVEALQGDWFRVGGNNPTNNGMLVRVIDEQGVIILAQDSGFDKDDIKWKDILSRDEENYDYSELGSDYNYYNAQMEIGTDDTLRISVAAAGAGNIQKWVRDFAEFNDCMPYEPMNDENTINEFWDAINETDLYTGLLPAVTSPGGGYYTVVLTNDSGAVPGLKVTSSDDTSGAIANSTAAATSDENTRTTSFLVYPEVSYDIAAHYSSHVPAGTSPTPYEIIWSYTDIVDCYEPNDEFSEAKAIPKNEIIEAYALTGHINNSVTYGEPQSYDYYSIQLRKPAKIKVELLEVPSSVNLNVKVFTTDGQQLITDYEEVSGVVSEDGAIYNTQTSSILEEGKYIIRVTIGGSRPTVVNDDQDIPDHWNSPYTFKVTTAD
ncbi:hypothetical protein [Maribacter sp. 4G9]|uniref:hypothetical protein n=1 Tax=Maribacter sp. 4G9 TaxID=1889777 RepID=UPI000C15573A|nr:hypothetical protein [Maribacter sp. 4G9]PIB30442.1 hypothetical protein BFP75_02595 [Maribacter sp. 4G9]